mgnify:CR=1 FL=1
MKNNEIMISVQFNFPNDDIYGELAGTKDSLAFLVKDDITLKAFLEGLYYGLHNHFISHFLLYKDYIKQRNQIAVNFTRKGKFKVIDCEKELKNANRVRICNFKCFDDNNGFQLQRNGFI